MPSPNPSSFGNFGSFLISSSPVDKIIICTTGTSTCNDGVILDVTYDGEITNDECGIIETLDEICTLCVELSKEELFAVV